MNPDRCNLPTAPRRRKLRWLLLSLAVASAFVLALPLAQGITISLDLEDSDGCAVTPGGWGAEPAGNNPGALLHENFDDLYPGGLMVGDLFFEEAQDVTDALPYGAGWPEVFMSHTVALRLNVDFGDAGLLDGTVSDVEVEGGTYDGWTAAEILAEAEDVLVNDDTITAEEHEELKDAMDALNNEEFGCHEAPDCPTGVTAVPQSDGTIDLSWGEVEDAVEYGIYRGTDGGDLVFLDSTSDTEFTDDTVAVGSTYEYMITAWDGTLESQDCTTVVATAIPFFTAPILGALALVGSVGAFRLMRRKP